MEKCNSSDRRAAFTETKSDTLQPFHSYSAEFSVQVRYSSHWLCTKRQIPYLNKYTNTLGRTVNFGILQSNQFARSAIQKYLNRAIFPYSAVNHVCTHSVQTANFWGNTAVILPPALRLTDVKDGFGKHGRDKGTTWTSMKSQVYPHFLLTG